MPMIDTQLSKKKKKNTHFWIHIYAKRYIALLSFVGFNYNSIDKVFNHHHRVYTIDWNYIAFIYIKKYILPLNYIVNFTS